MYRKNKRVNANCRSKNFKKRKGRRMRHGKKRLHILSNSTRLLLKNERNNKRPLRVVQLKSKSMALFLEKTYHSRNFGVFGVFVLCEKKNHFSYSQSSLIFLAGSKINSLCSEDNRVYNDFQKALEFDQAHK